jgi:hypothetical protein
MLAGNFWKFTLLIICSIQINSSISFFWISNKVNNVSENNNFAWIQLSSWRCWLWNRYSSPYSMQVLGQKLSFSVPRKLVGRSWIKGLSQSVMAQLSMSGGVCQTNQISNKIQRIVSCLSPRSDLRNFGWFQTVPDCYGVQINSISLNFFSSRHPNTDNS